MFVIRPVQASDLDALLGLAAQTSFGLTTLPKDTDWLAGRIRDSEDAFRRLADQRPRSTGWRNMLTISHGPSCSFSRWSVRISLRMPSIFDSWTLVSIR